MRIYEIKQLQSKVDRVKRFAAWAIKELAITGEPKIEYGNDMGRVKTHRTFGSTTSNGAIWTHIGNRNTADIMRTLCHELVHFKQFEDGTATNGMDDEQRLRVEDEANAVAGRLMRAYGKQHEDIYERAPASTKMSGTKVDYEDYVLFANGKEAMRFSTEREAQDFIRLNRLDTNKYVLKKQVCQYQPVKESAVNKQLERQLLKHKKTDYDSIDKMMTTIADENDITPKKLHDVWVDEYGVTPDTWIKRQLKNIKEDQWKFSKFVLNENNVDKFIIAFNLRQKQERAANPELPFRSSQLLSSTLRSLVEDKMWESKNDAIRDLKEFQHYLTTIDGRDRVNMTVGSEVAVIQFEPHTSAGVIEGRGFQTPKKIDNIEHQADGTIDYIEFSDGSSFPDAEFVSRGMGGEYEGISTMFFSTHQEADYATTLAALNAPSSWKFNITNIKN